MCVCVCVRVSGVSARVPVRVRLQICVCVWGGGVGEISKDTKDNLHEILPVDHPVTVLQGGVGSWVGR